MMELACKQTAEDIQKHLAFIQAQVPTKNKFILLITFVVSTFFTLLIIGFLFSAEYFDAAHLWLFRLSLLLYGLSFLWGIVWRKRGGMNAYCEKYSGEYHWELNAEGISASRNGNSGFHPWSSVLALTETEDCWYLFIKRTVAISIPKCAINAEDAERFVHEVTNYWTKHKNNYGLVLQNNVLQGLKQKSFWRDLYTNLCLGVKLAFFCKLEPLDFKVRNSQIIGLALVNSIVIAAYNYSLYYPDVLFNIYGVTDYATGFVLFLLTVLMISHLTVNWAWQRLAVMLLVCSLVVKLFYYLPSGFLYQQDWYLDDSKYAWGLWTVNLVWLLCVVARCFKRLYGFPNHSQFFLVALYTFFVLTLSGLLPQQTFFTRDYSKEDAEEQEEIINQEATYYQQPVLLNKILSPLKKERKGNVDLYFVGFAGNAYQDVFANEVNYARDLLDKKYDTQGRSAVLINNKDTVQQTPLANEHNLASTLNAVGKLMNTDEDVLFLFLSSHGSKTFEISTDFYPFGMNDLSVDKLKEVLDKSGIKNRVIVVSACYSGGFIDKLKNENTLILTAARQDRRSFGCSNELKYTYFGDAYFVQALAKESSFITAFGEAEKIIAAREKNEQADSPASLPQIYVGQAIKTKLAALSVNKL